MRYPEPAGTKNSPPEASGGERGCGFHRATGESVGGKAARMFICERFRPRRKSARGRVLSFCSLRPEVENKFKQKPDLRLLQRIFRLTSYRNPYQQSLRSSLQQQRRMTTRMMIHQQEPPNKLFRHIITFSFHTVLFYCMSGARKCSEKSKAGKKEPRKGNPVPRLRI